MLDLAPVPIIRKYDGINMAVTQADIDNLNEAIASGTRQVTIGGQSVTYQTTESLIKARNDMVKQLAQQATTRRSRTLNAYHAGRGFQ